MTEEESKWPRSSSGVAEAASDLRTPSTFRFALPLAAATPAAVARGSGVADATTAADGRDAGVIAGELRIPVRRTSTLGGAGEPLGEPMGERDARALDPVLLLGEKLVGLLLKLFVGLRLAAPPPPPPAREGEGCATAWNVKRRRPGEGDPALPTWPDTLRERARNAARIDDVSYAPPPELGGGDALLGPTLRALCGSVEER